MSCTNLKQWRNGRTHHFLIQPLFNHYVWKLPIFQGLLIFKPYNTDINCCSFSVLDSAVPPNVIKSAVTPVFADFQQLLQFLTIFFYIFCWDKNLTRCTPRHQSPPCRPPPQGRTTFSPNLPDAVLNGNRPEIVCVFRYKLWANLPGRQLVQFLLLATYRQYSQNGGGGPIWLISIQGVKCQKC